MTTNAGRTAALRTLGLEKTAVGWHDLATMAPDLGQHLPHMASAAGDLIGNVGHGLWQGAQGVGHGIMHGLHALRDFGGWAGGVAGPTAVEGGVLHVGANAGMRKILHSPTGQKLERNLTTMGIRHGMEGKTLSPLITTPFTGWVGPELASSYSVGRGLGGLLQSGNDAQRTRILQAAQKLVSDPAVKASPAGYIGDALGQAMAPAKTGPMGRLFNKLFLRKGTPSKLESAAALGMTGTLAALDPTGISHAHVPLNALRHVVGNSSIGASTAAEGFTKGLLGMAPKNEKATDLIVSPALLHPQRVGYALNDAIRNRTGETASNAYELAKAVSDLPPVREPVQRKLQEGQRAVADATAGAVRAGKERLQQGWQKFMANPSWQRNALIGGSVLGAGALGYGGYRMYQNHKQKQEEAARKAEEQRILQGVRAYMAQNPQSFRR